MLLLADLTPGQRRGADRNVLPFRHHNRDSQTITIRDIGKDGSKQRIPEEALHHIVSIAANELRAIPERLERLQQFPEVGLIQRHSAVFLPEAVQVRQKQVCQQPDAGIFFVPRGTGCQR